MKDCTTGEKVIVHDEGIAGPYIIIPENQYPELKNFLEQHQIAHNSDEDIVMGDIIVNLDPKTNLGLVQNLLDRLP